MLAAVCKVSSKLCNTNHFFPLEGCHIEVATFDPRLAAAVIRTIATVPICAVIGAHAVQTQDRRHKIAKKETIHGLRKH